MELVGMGWVTWFSGRRSKMSTILAAQPYRGKYRDFFTHDIQVTAPNTRRGWMWMSINIKDIA